MLLLGNGPSTAAGGRGAEGGRGGGGEVLLKAAVLWGSMRSDCHSVV